MRKSQFADHLVTFVGTFAVGDKYVKTSITGPRDEVVPIVRALHFVKTGRRVPKKEWEQAWYDRVINPSRRTSVEKTYEGHWRIS